MVDFGCEIDDGGLEGVVGGEVEVEFEVAALGSVVRDGCGCCRWGKGWDERNRRIERGRRLRLPICRVRIRRRAGL